ncbi:hypothetical protein VRZ08_06750 [Rhodopseudomonas sp. G2_2311]|uniref:hypothetical protein n=1 Tax=Rhodopseudomonas sp. G2_2311 TaxID=3114287 RepID=UPI0039C5DB56
MRRTVFYSWQSDLESKFNRNLIEDALERALKAIKRDDSAIIEPILDRDTCGMPGSPAIADTIFNKIATADVFVADVSIINSGAGGRKAPNPNVLVELGYAISQLGWHRILLVQNTAFGGPESLPFDLRGRRAVCYCSSNATDKSETRRLLQGRLEAELRGALGDIMASQAYAGPQIPLWWGNWTIESGYGARDGNLFIREVGSAGFVFDLMTSNGAHTGAVSGFARIVSPDIAYARMPASEADQLCELAFRRTIAEHGRQILIEELGDCHLFRGMGATFSGRYTWKHLALFEGGILDEIDLQRLYSIAGQYFDPMMNCFQGLSDGENYDDFVAHVTLGGIRGLHTIMEGIIMRGERGQLWAAYIDDDVLRYFTTEREYQSKLPSTFERWRERFEDKAIVFDAGIDRIPPAP